MNGIQDEKRKEERKEKDERGEDIKGAKRLSRVLSWDREYSVDISMD